MSFSRMQRDGTGEARYRTLESSTLPLITVRPVYQINNERNIMVLFVNLKQAVVKRGY